MHAIHTVLVNLEYEGLTKENEIIRHAEDVTADYQHNAFDWRTVQGVIIGSDKPDKLINLLGQCYDAQQKQITEYLKIFNNNLGDSLSQIIFTLSNDSTYVHEFNELAKFLAGEYIFESKFFDTERCTSRIDKDILDEVREAPESYALVLFDCHN